MRRYHWGFLITVFIAVCQCSAENPTALEVLDKFAETQKTFRSFIIKTESESHNTDKGFGNKPEKTTSTNELITDGYRFSRHSLIVGNMGDGTIFTKDKAAYNSNLWDGKTYYSYSTNTKELGIIVITKPLLSNNPDTFNEFLAFYAGYTMGYLKGERTRIDKVLRKAGSLRIRNKMEKVGDSMCYVLEGCTEYGRYKIWFDPSHDYNMAKAIHTQKTGDKTSSADYVLQKNEQRQSSFINSKFKKVGGKWFPVEYSGKNSFKYKHGQSALSKWHTKVIEIELNPDHEKLNSFVLDDIPNGAMAVDTEHPEIDYKWQKGKLVPTNRNLPTKSP